MRVAFNEWDFSSASKLFNMEDFYNPVNKYVYVCICICIYIVCICVYMYIYIYIVIFLCEYLYFIKYGYTFYNIVIDVFTLL